MTSPIDTGTDASAGIGAAQRLHGLDALRASALLLGIVLHSLLPFVPDLPWLVNDSESSWLAAVPVYVIHLFRMTLFMLLAGYFGRLVLQRRGPGAYLRDRVLRILLPLIVFWPVSVLSLGILAVINAQVHGVALPAPPTPPPASANPLAAINPGQLWFLWVLMQCVVIVLALRGVAVLLLGQDRLSRLAAGLGGLLSSPYGVLLAAIPYALALLQQGSVLGGIIAPASLLPELPALTAYLGAFVVGWSLHARSDALVRLARIWLPLLAAAVLLSVLGWFQSDPTRSTPLPAAAMVMALAGWCWVLGLLGASGRFLTAEQPWVRYLADASYWMYLIHLPLLVAVEIPLVTLDWPIMIKLLFTGVVVGSVLLISYHLLVRSTPIGRWLNGRRYPFRIPGRRTR
jgi:glucan biosynthesis protein C